MVEEFLRLCAVVGFREVGEHVVRGNLEAVLHRDFAAAGEALVIKDMGILVIAGNDAVMGGDGLLQGGHVAVLHQGEEGDGLHHGTLLAHFLEDEVV